MTCGTSIAGSRRSYLGTLHGINTTPIGYDGTVVSWDVDQVQEIDCSVAVYADGRLQALAPANGTAALTSLGDGTHTLSARLVGHESNPPSRIWHLGAQRVWIRWRPDTVPDLAAYVVQVDDDGDWVDVAEITRRSVGELNKRRPMTGSGSGRLSVFGGLNSNLSGTISLVVNSGNIDLVRDSTVMESRELIPQATIIFSSGMRVYVVDSVELYQDGDTWTTTTGIDCNWQSDVLEPGNYTYRVLAKDNVGNRSTTVGQFAVRIQQLPEEAPIPTLSVTDNGDGTYAVGIDVDALTSDGSIIEVYTNYDVALSRFQDRIYTRSPLTILSSTSQEIISAAPTGELRLYLWTRLDGVLRDDAVVHSVHLPLSPEDEGIKLGPIIGLKLMYDSEGMPSVSWSYNFDENGSDCTSFDVLFQVNSATPDWGSSSNYPTSANVVDQGGSIVSYKVEGGTPATTGDTLYVWLRPRADSYDVAGDAVTASTAVDVDPPPAPEVELAMPS